MGGANTDVLRNTQRRQQEQLAGQQATARTAVPDPNQPIVAGDQYQGPTPTAPRPNAPQPYVQQNYGYTNPDYRPTDESLANQAKLTPAQMATFWAWDNPNGGDTRRQYIANPGWTNDSWSGNYRNEAGYIPSVKEVTQRIIREGNVDVNDMQAVLNALGQYGIQATNPGPGLIDFGTGEGPIRLADWKTMLNNGIDLEAQNALPNLENANTTTGTGTGTSGDISSGGNYGGGPAPYQPPEAPPNPYSAAMEKAILELLNTSRTVDPQELAGSPENAAYNLASQRAAERDRAALAERASAQGFSGSGGFETGLQGINQQRGEGEAAFLGQLAVTRMQQQREDIKSGIQYAMASSQFDKAQALQDRLAQLDAAIRREQIASQQSIANANLTEQGRQFDLDLGYRYTGLEQNANQAALLAMLK